MTELEELRAALESACLMLESDAIISGRPLRGQVARSLRDKFAALERELERETDDCK